MKDGAQTIYLDIKSSFSGPISDFIREDDQFVIGQWNNGKGEPYEGWGIWPEVGHVPGGEFQQWFMIATPGHLFLRAAICAAVAKIENYDAWRDGVGYLGVMRTTGPILYTRAIALSSPIVRRKGFGAALDRAYTIKTLLDRAGRGTS